MRLIPTREACNSEIKILLNFILIFQQQKNKK